MTLEVCCGNPESVHAAVKGGAPRIELCSQLELDGLTPEWVYLREARKRYPSLIIHVLIRPRAGDFCYLPSEVKTMVRDIRTAINLGADGIVTGVLDASSEVHLPAMRQLMEAAEGMPVTFHRAFDVCRNPFQALEAIGHLGCSRILTSGQAATALEGAPLIRRLQEKTDLILLPGGGVTPENARRILEITGSHELHASASEMRPDGSKVTSAAKVAQILAEF